MAHSLGWVLVGFIAATIALVCVAVAIRRDTQKRSWQNRDLTSRLLYHQRDEEDWE